MAPSRFAYKKVLRSDGSGRVSSMIAFRLAEDRSLQAVIWSAKRKIWMFAPAIAVQFIYDPDYMDRVEEIDRPKAEHIARQALMSELPSEDTLAAMCEQGERMGWELGPPEK